jgi:hypothetical protein
MKANYRRILWLLSRMTLGALLGFSAPPYIGGVYYSLCGDRQLEQQYLDQCIDHLRHMRVYCDDPDLAGILDYTIDRYHTVGAWNVMFMPLVGVKPGYKVIGCNDPLCPGVTLDPCLLLELAEDTALVVVHEALHDYRPWYGHDHINPRERKLYKLSYVVRRLRRSDDECKKVHVTP